jgi:hypothetical protein
MTMDIFETVGPCAKREKETDEACCDDAARVMLVESDLLQRIMCLTCEGAN